MLGALNEARGETEATLARQRQFVADASHELRTPLTSVLANLELLEMELEGEPREAAASALRSSRRMRRLVADLLLLARADAGRAAPHTPRRPVRGRGRGGGRARAGGRRPPDQRRDRPGRRAGGRARRAPPAHAQPARERAPPHRPRHAVEATVERIDGEVVLSVEDDGPGIPPELHDKVFERFFRGAGDRSGSSGLGLSIVRAVAASHDGSVSLEDPLDGRGARFVVRFPASRAEPCADQLLGHVRPLHRQVAGPP